MFISKFSLNKNYKSPEFLGNQYLDYFRIIIYYFIIFTSFNILSKSKNNFKTNKKYLFLLREWSEETTLIREFSSTLKESVNPDNIYFLKLTKYQNITPAILKIIKNNPITHVFIDVRFMTVSNNFFSKLFSLYKSRYISSLLKFNNVVCICGVTDWFPPGYRLLAGLLTSAGGIALMYAGIDSNKAPPFFHNRVIDPFYPPLSIDTLNKVKHYHSNKINNYDVAIIGLNYEPRKTIVLQLIKYLQNKKITYFFYDKKDLSYINYLAIFRNSKIVFNTNWVVEDKNKYHCVGRNFEALATGSMLITQSCEGLDYYFTEGIDYINFNSLESLKENISYYIKNDIQRKTIADSGKKKVNNLYNKGKYINKINKNLNKFNYTEIKDDSFKNTL